MGRLDKSFVNTEGTEVKSTDGFIRYKKQFKDGLSSGRKQGRFHSKTKNLAAGTRRD